MNSPNCPNHELHIGTRFSLCRKYRYTLWRQWDCDSLTGCADDLDHADEFVQFIGLNPSTADETKNDPTVARCIDYAKRWGYGAMCMTNLFAFRATDPEVMKKEPFCASSPDSPGANAHWLLLVAQSAGLVVAAWGKDGNHHCKHDLILGFLRENGVTLHHLGLNKDRTPKHPLYLPKTLKPIPYPPL